MGARFLISSQTLASSAATVTFSSIPATYTDLVLRVSARVASAVSQTDMYIYTNGSQTNNSDTILYSNGSTVYSARNINAPAEWYGGQVDGASATTSTFSSAEYYYPNYAGSANKVGLAFMVSENNSATLNSILVGAELRSNTAAITSIIFDSNGANFVSGSSFYLYGISKTN